jgi:type IV secretory pathway VirB4 component
MGARAERARQDLLRSRQRSQSPSWRLPGPGGLVLPGERRGHKLTTAHIQAAYPMVASSSLGSTGVLIGRDEYGTGAFCFDPFGWYHAGHTRDPSAIVLGEKGSGKSCLLKCIASRSRVFGRRVEIIVGGRGGELVGEYEALVSALEGVNLRIRPGVGLNPIERHGNAAARQSLLRAVTAMLLGRPLKPAEARGLSTVLPIVDAELSDREVVIPDVVSELQNPSQGFADVMNRDRRELADELRDCMDVLGDLTAGPLGGLFDRPSIAADWTNPVICLDLGEIAETAHGADESVALGVSMLCATAALDAHRRQRGATGEKSIRIADEAWRAISSGDFLAYMIASLKLSRKTGQGWLIALHRLGDLSAAGDQGSRAQQLAESIASECATRIIAKQHPSQVDLTASTFMLSETEKALIGRLGVGEHLWKLGNTHRSFRVRHYVAPTEREWAYTDQNMAA